MQSNPTLGVYGGIAIGASEGERLAWHMAGVVGDHAGGAVIDDKMPFTGAGGGHSRHLNRTPFGTLAMPVIVDKLAQSSVSQRLAAFTETTHCHWNMTAITFNKIHKNPNNFHTTKQREATNENL